MLSLTPLPLSQAELPDWRLAVAMGELSSLNHFLPKKKNLLLVFDILFEKANFTSLLRNRLLFDIMITHRTTWNHLWKSGASLWDKRVVGILRNRNFYAQSFRVQFDVFDYLGDYSANPTFLLLLSYTLLPHAFMLLWWSIFKFCQHKFMLHVSELFINILYRKHCLWLA